MIKVGLPAYYVVRKILAHSSSVHLSSFLPMGNVQVLQAGLGKAEVFEPRAKRALAPLVLQDLLLARGVSRIWGAQAA